jgi:hypothetical protein
MIREFGLYNEEGLLNFSQQPNTEESKTGVSDMGGR